MLTSNWGVDRLSGQSDGGRRHAQDEQSHACARWSVVVDRPRRLVAVGNLGGVRVLVGAQLRIAAVDAVVVA
jgi:hypothetical protein